jgi:hypothetical protein
MHQRDIPRPRLVRRLLLPAAALVAVAGLSACGDSGDAASTDTIASIDGAASEPVAGDGATDVEPTSFREAILEFSACMREQGLDFPDPDFDADGNIVFGDGAGGPGAGGPAQDDPAFEAAQEACGDLLEGVQDAFQPDPEQQAELRDSLLEFAACMRGEGIDFPDPEFGADGNVQLPVAGPDGEGGLAAMQDAPAFEAAAETCQEALGDIPGPGGFGGGDD